MRFLQARHDAAVVESRRLAQVARPDPFQNRSEQQVPEAKQAIE